ncbi:hypothetical protein H0H87_008178 [Tephrocybe sp. NHM501043]|nr:hypothetical protein H0H87_008178 [Tephrocybe sp. NHM501043]
MSTVLPKFPKCKDKPQPMDLPIPKHTIADKDNYLFYGFEVTEETLAGVFIKFICNPDPTLLLALAGIDVLEQLTGFRNFGHKRVFPKGHNPGTDPSD